MISSPEPFSRCTLSHPDDRRPSRADHCCTPAPSSDVAHALDELLEEEIPADVAAIRSAGFRMLLETGRPVAVDDLIAATGIATDRIDEILDSVRARGRVEFNSDSHLIGIAGLSLTPSRHQLIIGNNTRWTWCALDAVGILCALGATGTVRSTDPQTGESIQIEFVDGSPDTDTQLFILNDYADGSVREDWCPRVNFFATLEAAQVWIADNKLAGSIVAVSQIAGAAADVWRPVVNTDSPQNC